MRIAHITDLHMRMHVPGTSRGTFRLSRRVPDLLACAAEEIRHLKPDIVIVTGDLVDHPFYALQDGSAREAAADDVRYIRTTLERCGCPVLIIHGNHDDRISAMDLLGDQPDDVTIAGHRFVLFHDEEVDRNVPQRMGDDRERFHSVLSDDDPTPQVHVQHYLVWPRKNEGYPHTYLEAESIRDQIADSGRVRFVISGHYHPGIEPFQHGGTWYAAGPAFAEPPHTYRIYDVDETGVTCTNHALRDGSEPRQKVVFLDRDGNINPQPSYRWGPEPFELIPGAAGALRRLKDAGYALVVVTNQSCVGYGFVTAETVGAVNDKMAALLKTESGVELDGVYNCHHTPNAVIPAYRGDAPCIKPKPGMLLKAAEELHLDLNHSFMVGDSLSDLEAGHNAGARSILVKTGNGQKALKDLPPGLADAVAADISEAADWILAQDD